MTGDLVEGDKNNFHVSLNFLDELTKSYEVYHIIGNHEQKSLIKKYKKSMNFILRNLVKSQL
ncbi:hypothetical protein [Paraclostridium sp. AKS81]|uniref:hypothetical protein n=1 Tax=Paraclostridium sp. AKS81 TaxID=2876117 RepID=UPI0021DFAD47|nr:hypothetical protein [Paraclostridium sp. AKS81]